MSKQHQYDISIIIPFKDKAQMTLACVNSIHNYGPRVKEVLLVSNNSSVEELSAIKKGISKYQNTRLVEYNHPFNYQKLNNWAVRQTSGSHILFLNNDTELTQNSKGLIERLHQKSTEAKVGITGCLLLFAGEKKIQHAGVFLVPGGLAEHLYVTKKYSSVLQKGGQNDEYPYDITKDIPMTAVTGAVSLIERKKFNAVNGFDERFIICGGDVDICIRLNQAGYQTWFMGGPEYIIHKESISRKFTPIPYNDFYWSYQSYSRGYDEKSGDPFLPKAAEKINY